MAQLETFLDVLLIEEIPVQDATSTGIVDKKGNALVRTEKASRKPMYGKVVACDTRFPYNGIWVDMPYKPGDIVKTNEFGRDYQTFSVEDEKPGATKYYLIRYEDIQGRRAS